MRKKLATKICAIVMTAAMIGTMAGCGNDSGSNASDSTPQSESGSSEEQGGADNASDETPADEGGEAEGGEEAGGEEETYDFGGAVVRVEGGIFSDLNEESKLDEEGNVKTGYTKKRDIADQLEQKYNIKIEYVTRITDGYDEISSRLTPITNGEAHADIFTGGDEVTIGLRDYLADITADVDQLEIGDTYIEPARWNGKVYGWTYDNMGSCYVLCYSREYLNSIGMDETPTDKFMKGEWDYDSCREYLNEMKSKLPDGTYPIAVHSNHWVSMAPAANGVVSVDSDGNINLTDDAYISALNFYQSLIDNQLTAPAENVEIAENGGISADQLGDAGMSGMSGKTEGNSYVITMVEAWQYQYMLNDKGEWGIVPFPWDPNYTTIDESKLGQPDAYTTLSDSYLAPQSIWTNVMVPKAEYRGEGAKDIPDIVLHKIAQEFCDMDSPDGAAVRHAAWEAESKGEKYENYGYKPGDPGHFSTPEDIEVFDWLHTRATVDWGHAFNGNTVVRVNRNGYYVLAAGRDARTTGESFTVEGEQNMKDMGLK